MDIYVNFFWFPYFLFLWFSTSSKQQLMTSQIRSYIEYLIQIYNFFVLVIYSKFMKSLVLVTVLNTILWSLLSVAYFLDHPVDRKKETKKIKDEKRYPKAYNTRQDRQLNNSVDGLIRISSAVYLDKFIKRERDRDCCMNGILSCAWWVTGLITRTSAGIKTARDSEDDDYGA